MNYHTSFSLPCSTCRVTPPPACDACPILIIGQNASLRPSFLGWSRILGIKFPLTEEETEQDKRRRMPTDKDADPAARPAVPTPVENGKNGRTGFEKGTER